MNNQSKPEIKKISPPTVALERVTFFGIKSTQELEGLYTENYKISKTFKKTEVNGNISVFMG